MKIYLYLNDRIKVFTIPAIVSGSYNFDEDDEAEDKLINIDAKDNNWVFYTTKESKVYSNDQIVDELQLKPYNFYKIFKNGVFYIVYVENLVEENLKSYSFDNNINIVVGSDNNCTVAYKRSFNPGVLFQIGKVNGQFVLEKPGTNKLYINNVAFEAKQRYLQPGDVVEYYGFRLIFLNNRILMNDAEGSIVVNEVSSGLRSTLKEKDEYSSLDVKDQELYEKNDFFTKSPRIRRVIETKEIELTSPPPTENNNMQSVLITMGPMFVMALTSLVTLGSVGQSLLSGEKDFSSVWPQVLTTVLMIVSTAVWPIIARKYEKKLDKKRKAELLKKYNYYLDDKRKELDLERKNQREILFENLITIEECLNIIKLKNMQLWDKRLDQSDFSVVRLGMGNEKLDVDIKYPEEGFSIEENELKDAVDQMKKEYEYIENVPIGYSLAESKITAVMGNIDKGYYFIYNILVQLLTFYSYEDLKIVIITNENNEKKWDFMKYSLHSFNNEKTLRFFSATPETTQIIMDYLYQELNYRSQANLDTPTPHYLIITDDYHRIKSQEFIKNLTEIDEEINAGMSMLILEKRMNNLPSKCSHFINIGDKTSGVLKNSYEKQEQVIFTDEVNYTINMMDIIRVLSNIPIEFSEGGEAALPESLTFLEMEKVGKVEQLNILSRWNSNSPTETLRAELGVGENGETMYLDLHEKAHGPHGLIAGMTGSGKSEFIITYLLSMAINYSPDDVAFILIDYKGGGLAFAFENKQTGVVLPHLAGTITNLDKAEMDRTLVSIDSESKRRQMIFNETRDKLGESTIDIYKYQRFYKEGKVKEPIPHLLIVCDEFAELKSQQPDFMDNLISIARIGRSLGIHLILATQKPSGVVNDQIWSNSKFHICLKVQDASDSNEMLKKPDAANLKQAGRFYLQVGYDEYFALGQSAWCGAKYFPSEKIVKEIDKSVNLLADNGLIIKKIQASGGQKKVEAQGEQLAAIMGEIIKTSEKVNKKAKRLWLDNIPDEITIEETINKYNYDYSGTMNFIIGEYDAPEEQNQGLLIHNVLENGNTKIIGTESDENELFLKNMLYQLVKRYTSKILNFYVIDYGGQALRTFDKAPHCGGYVIQGEDEKYNNLIKLLKEELDKRKKVLSNYNGQFKNYIAKGNKDLAIDVIIINNVDSLKDSNSDLLETFPDLIRDSERYGMVYYITGSTSSSLPQKIDVSISSSYAYKLKDIYEYREVIGIKAKGEPRAIFGRGLYKANETTHEFQTTTIAKEGQDETAIIEKELELITKNNPTKAKSIPELPEQVLLEHVQDKIKKFKNVPIGIRKDTIEVARYDFTSSLGTIVCANKIEYTKSFVKSLVKEFQLIENTKVIVLDSDGFLEDINKNNKNYYKENLGDVLGGVANFFKDQVKENVVVFVYGFGKIKDSIIDTSTLGVLVNNMKKQDKDVALILIDVANKFRDVGFEDWFRNGISEKDGIFIGTGAGDQGIIKTNSFSKELSEKLDNNFGFQIVEGVPTLIKLIEFEKIIEEDEDE